MARRLMPALHAGQAADKRRIARLGVGIDLEHDLLVREFGPVLCHSRPLAEKGEMALRFVWCALDPRNLLLITCY